MKSSKWCSTAFSFTIVKNIFLSALQKYCIHVELTLKMLMYLNLDQYFAAEDLMDT